MTANCQSGKNTHKSLKIEIGKVICIVSTSVIPSRLSNNSKTTPKL